MNRCTPAQIEQITKHVRSVVETVIQQENLNILFEDLTDFDSDENDLIQPMFVVTFNAPRHHRPEALIDHSRRKSDEQDEIPF